MESSEAATPADLDVEGLATTANADLDNNVPNNADADRPEVVANADTDVGPPTNADERIVMLTRGYCGPSKDIMPASKSPLQLFYYFMPKTFWRKVAAQTNLHVSKRQGLADSQDEAYHPEDDEGGDTLPVCDASRRILREHKGSSPLNFNYTDVLDPNLVEPSGENSLDTDGEGDEDSAEAADGGSDDGIDESADSCKTDCLQRELSHSVGLLSDEERERLHMNIQGSSEVYNDDELDEMKHSGWEVLPENTAAEVTNQTGVDKM
ncbi:hypothetical protein PHMEG_00028113 [Phytophthora megakarya]|uniref:Uncharacterized protein n=1 Tax=Phytophthora megakarya TaxID=4795 RepID=A0A225V5T4_9STRA|nr:hypothetical protein PHMEG_00028113 [Phytophthora megakarya]